MKGIEGVEVIGCVRDGGPDGPAESLTLRVPPQEPIFQFRIAFEAEFHGRVNLADVMKGIEDVFSYHDIRATGLVELIGKPVFAERASK